MLQSWPKYFRQAVFFLWNGTLRGGGGGGGSIPVFQEFFTSVDKVLIWERGWAPGYDSMGF